MPRYGRQYESVKLVGSSIWLLFTFTLTFLLCFARSPPDPPLHWMPLARLEKNRSRTPLLPEPTAMDMLYEQLKVNLGLCLCERETNRESLTSLTSHRAAAMCNRIYLTLSA